MNANTVKGYDMILRQLCLFVRDREIEDITIDDVTAWFNLMQELNWDVNSFVPKAMALRKLFEFYRRLGYNVLDPWLVPVPRKEYKLPRIADEKNYRKLLKVIPVETKDARHIRNRAIVNLLWVTGARIGEILSLDIEDIDLRRGKAIVRTEKSRGWRPIRELFWTRETSDSLERWVACRKRLKDRLEFAEPDALFVSIASSMHMNRGRRFTLKGSGEMLRRYSNKAKIPYQNAHSFRHHMGHLLARKGANNTTISSILGHSSIQSSYPYTMMTDKELEQVYRKHKGV